MAREDGGEAYLVGYLVQRRPDISYGELTAWLRERLPAYMIPSAFVAIEKLPLTANGKVDRRALLTMPVTHVERPIDPPQDDLETQLAAIFERLLGVPRVGRNESFFDLGGHSLLAARLFSEVNAIASHPISFGVIFQRPSVAALAELIAKNLPGDEARVIPLNGAQEGRALFCICGIQLYKELADVLGAKQQVYGVYLPAEEEAIAAGKPLRVEELAAGYLAAVREEQPQGPYLLAGASFGGVLAYEMAQQLRAVGERVELLALFDTDLPRAERLRPIRWAKTHLSTAYRHGVGYLTSRLVRGLFGRRPSVAGPDAASAQAQALSARIQAYQAATALYDQVIRPYPGVVTLFRAEVRNDFAGYDVDPTLGWSGLVHTVDIQPIDATHLGILSRPHVEDIAVTLRRKIEARRTIKSRSTTG
jgi:thioesterase domain-containing protein